MTPREALSECISLAGSQAQLARMCGVRPQAVNRWHQKGQCPADRVRRLEEVVEGKITRYQLRPDLYG